MKDMKRVVAAQLEDLTDVILTLTSCNTNVHPTNAAHAGKMVIQMLKAANPNSPLI